MRKGATPSAPEKKEISMSSAYTNITFTNSVMSQQEQMGTLRWISDIQGLPGYIGMPGMWS